MDHRAGYVEGTVDVNFAAHDGRAATMLVLDAVNMDIESVLDNEGHRLDWALDNSQLSIRLAEPLPPGHQTTVSVKYSCFPRQGLYFIHPDPSAAWHLWTQGESEDTRHWVPVWDQPNDRATHRLHLTVDSRFVTMGAGKLESSDEHPKEGTRTDVWYMATPHVSYLITFVAGDYAVGSLQGSHIPLPVLTEKEHLETSLINFTDTANMMDYFEEVIGYPYPYSKYAQTCVRQFVAGGMENISATTLYYEAIHHPEDEPQQDMRSLLAHELAHQWYGDLLTCSSWSHIWLNEGFATFFEDLWMGDFYGPDHYRWRMYNNQRAYIEEELEHSHPIVWDTWERPDDVFDNHAYPGGSARLNLLRTLLGDDAFFDGITHYTKSRAEQVVDTSDFQQAMEETTDVDLDLFFEEWIYEPGFPVIKAHLSASSRKISTSQRGHGAVSVSLVIEQIQKEKWGWRAVFHAPVAVAWSRGGVEHQTSIELDQRVMEVPLPGAGPLDWVRFDAETVLPMVLDFSQSESMWRNQLTSASDALTRLVAAEQFAALPQGLHPNPDSIAALQAAAKHDAFTPTRVTAIQALTGLHHREADTLLQELILDEDPEVREAAASALAEVTDVHVAPLLFKAAEDSNASVVSASIGALVDREHPASFTLLSDKAKRADPLRWRLTRDLVVLSPETGHRDVLPFLIGMAKEHTSADVRGAAFETLVQLDDPDHRDLILAQLAEGLYDRSYGAREQAAYALGELGDKRARLLLEGRAQVEAYPQVLRAISQALANL